MILFICAMCDSKKLRFIKKQEVSGLLSNLGLKYIELKFIYHVIFCFKDIK